jgi:hypothetical protein
MDLLSARPLRWEIHPGMPFSYFHILVLVHTLVAALVASNLLRRVREQGTGFPAGLFTAFLRFGNPMRVLGMVYNVYNELVARDDGTTDERF